jgi:hypothetical protein
MDMNDPNYNVMLGSEIMDQQPQEPTEGEAVGLSAPQVVDDEIRTMILKRKEASREHRRPKMEIWDKCHKHYKQIYDTRNKESWQATTFIPASPKVAEVITSNMHSVHLAPDKPVEYQARRPIFENAVTDTNDLISVDCDKSMFKIHYTDMLRTKAIIGTGIGKVEYQKEYAEVTIKERVKQIP